MNLKQTLLEANLENIKKDLQSYLDNTKKSGVYQFPYLSESFVLFKKGYLGDYGSVLKLIIFNKDDEVGNVMIRKSGDVYIKNKKNQKKKSLEKVPNAPQLFGKILDVIK